MTKHRIGCNAMDKANTSSRITYSVTFVKTQYNIGERQRNTNTNCEKSVIDDSVTAMTRIFSSETDLSSICENPKLFPSLFVQSVISRIMGKNNKNGRAHIMSDSTKKAM